MSELILKTSVMVQEMVKSVPERLRDERAQTAAEYLGIIVVAALIITAIIGTGVAGTIAEGIKTQVEKIAGGGEK